MQKHRTSQSSSVKSTQVNPNGLTKIYLRTSEIPDFFAAQRAHYVNVKTRHAQHRKRWLITISLIGIIIAFFLFNEFGFGDDEGVIVIFWIIGVVIALSVIAAVYGGKVNKAKLQEAKGQMLSTFFTCISEDLHPESGLKGVIDHGKRNTKDIYKRKTSPHSGSKKIYYKFAWANLKFMLIDGTSLRLQCIDKLKEKGATVVRFQEIGKARITPNTIIYDLLPGQHFKLRKELGASENDLIQHAPNHGFSLANMLKESYRSKIHRRKVPLSPGDAPQSTQQSTPSTAPNVRHDLNKVNRLLDQSELRLKTERLGDNTLELRYFQNNTEHLLWLDIKVHEEDKRLGIRMPLLGEKPSALRLLKANPALAHGRFAYIPQKNAGTQQLCLLSLVDLETLTTEVLLTTLNGLCQMGKHLASHDLPEKTKASRAVREADWERTLLKSTVKSLSLVSEPEFGENKAKVRLKLANGRQQTVHIRFDRQDPEGNPLISLLSYCGADNAERYGLALQENSHYSYGAMGLDTLGEQQMFVVCENQLANTAETSRLQQAILQVAQKADQMEALLTNADVH